MLQPGLHNRSDAVIRNLLKLDSLVLVRYLLRGAQTVRRRLARGREQGIYDVLEHHTILELKDTKGEVAMVKRQQRVRFLQSHVAAITDHAWGDGEIFAEYNCSPGVPVDVYQDGSRHTVLISLREAKSRGDVLKFVIRRKIIGGFCRPEECWETEVYHRTRHLSVAIIFPQGRRCRRATVTQRSTNKTVTLEPKHFQFLGDGRQQLSWEIRNPRLHDRYSLRWEW